MCGWPDACSPCAGSPRSRHCRCSWWAARQPPRRVRHHRPHPAGSASPASVAPLKAPAPAAPAPPMCGDPTTLPTRDKLAQLLMVGVRDGADARAVVETYHVGGIMIGSWTDRSMLTDGSLPDYANAGPAAAGGQRRRGRRPGVAAVVAHRPGALGPRAGPDEDTRRGLPARPGPRPPDAGPGHHHRLRARRRRLGSGRRHRHRRPVLLQRPRGGHHLRRRLRTRPARCGSAAGAQALPGPRPRLG